MKISVNNESFKIKYDVIKLFFIVFPILKPTTEAMSVLLGNSVARLLYQLLEMWNFISIGIVVILFIYKFRNGVSKKKIMSCTLLMLALCVSLSISTFSSNEYNIVNMVRIFGNMSLLFLLANIYDGDKFKYYLTAIYAYLTFVMFLNAVTIYVYYPDAMYTPVANNSNYYLFGLDNIGFIYSLHGFFLGMIRNLISKHKLTLRFIITYAFIFGAYIYAQCGTATVILAAVVVVLMLYSNRLFNLVDYKRTLVVCLLLYFAIVVIQNLGSATGILKLIGKSETFNGRLFIWAAMLVVWPMHPIMGFGITATVTQRYLASAGPAWLSEIGHLHNIVLEFLFKGGIVGLALFLLIWVGCYKIMQKNRGHLLAKILCVQLLLSWLTCMFEYRLDTYTFWLVPITMYFLDTLIMEYNKH